MTHSSVTFGRTDFSILTYTYVVVGENQIYVTVLENFK